MAKKSTSEIAENLAKIVAQASFDIWQDPDFRKMIGFDNIFRTEQDRIFNELEVTVLGLVALHAGQRPVLVSTQKETTVAFLKLMSEAGVGQPYLKTWKLLINMRFKEYKKDFKIALDESRSWEDFKKDEGLRFVWARVETLTIDGLRHIRRGKVEKDDPLWKYLWKWLTMMEVVVAKALRQSLGKIKVGVC